MALGIYAGATKDAMSILPSPISVKPSKEIIWSEGTGRAQSGANKAKMVGDVVAEKMTYNIQWGIITEAEYNSILSKLTAGFFWFGVSTTLAGAKSGASTYYRSNVSSELLPVGNTLYYKDVTVDVVQQ